MAGLKIEKRLLRDGITLLALEGDLDAYTSPALEDAIEIIFSGGGSKLVFDLTKLIYLSSHGFGVLIGTLTALQERNGKLVLLQPNSTVLQVIEMLEARELFHYAKTLDEAFAVFSENK